MSEGLTGFVLDVVDRLGEVGLGALTLIETVVPPIPSEVVLPLAGYLAAQDRLSLVWALVAATVGSLLGALALYAAGARLGLERAERLLGRLPLVDEHDAERSVAWFARRGEVAVLVGRLVPGVRSLVSLPAGAARMPLARFCTLTIAGSALWNGLLIGAGYELGRHYELVERWTGVLDVAFVMGMAAAFAWLVARRVRRRAAT